jgi:hypothetical protein
MGLYSPTAIPTYVPTLRLNLDDASWQRVVDASGGERVLLQSSGDLLPEAPIDPYQPALGYSKWQYEGDFYRACRDQGLKLKPGALYLAVVHSPPLVRIRLAMPGPVTYLGLPDLLNATIAPLVAAANALVP